MDQILVSKILESDLTGSVEFKDILCLINRLSMSSVLRKWFKVSNNMIAFAAAIKKSYSDFNEITNEDAEIAVTNFEEAFKAFNPSKINLGKVRRELVNLFVSHISELKGSTSSELMERFMEETAQ